MRKHIESLFKNLSKDDPFYGMSEDEFLSLMQANELEIISTVCNYAAAEGIKQAEAIDACYHVMLGYFMDNFEDTSVFIVADAMAVDGDGIVRQSKNLQFVSCVLWNTWCEFIRECARDARRAFMNHAI